MDVVREPEDFPGSGIWLCGGGELAASLIDEIDRVIIKRYPVLLGDSVPLFATTPCRPRAFTLTGIKKLNSGVVFETVVRTRLRADGQDRGQSQLRIRDCMVMLGRVML